MTSMTDKVAIVTGASSGIGRAAALLLAREGASIVAGARGREGLDTLVAQITRSGGRAIAVTGDVCDEAFAQELVRTATLEFGGLDVALNNAGTTGDLGPTPELSPASWRKTLETNLTSAFLAARHQLPAMLLRGGGSLIFTSTFVGYTVGIPGTAAYAASKAGLIGLTQTLAAEFGPRAIRVNALLPGGTDTPMARQMNNTPEAWAGVEAMHALKRTATPEEIARAVLYLASDASSFTTGTAMLVDGGVSINRT